MVIMIIIMMNRSNSRSNHSSKIHTTTTKRRMQQQQQLKLKQLQVLNSGIVVCIILVLSLLLSSSCYYCVNGFIIPQSTMTTTTTTTTVTKSRNNNNNNNRIRVPRTRIIIPQNYRSFVTFATFQQQLQQHRRSLLQSSLSSSSNDDNNNNYYYYYYNKDNDDITNLDNNINNLDNTINNLENIDNIDIDDDITIRQYYNAIQESKLLIEQYIQAIEKEISNDNNVISSLLLLEQEKESSITLPASSLSSSTTTTTTTTASDGIPNVLLRPAESDPLFVVPTSESSTVSSSSSSFGIVVQPEEQVVEVEDTLLQQQQQQQEEETNIQSEQVLEEQLQEEVEDEDVGNVRKTKRDDEIIIQPEQYTTSSSNELPTTTQVDDDDITNYDYDNYNNTDITNDDNNNNNNYNIDFQDTLVLIEQSKQLLLSLKELQLQQQQLEEQVYEGIEIEKQTKKSSLVVLPTTTVTATAETTDIPTVDEILDTTTIHEQPPIEQQDDMEIPSTDPIIPSSQDTDIVVNLNDIIILPTDDSTISEYISSDSSTITTRTEATIMDDNATTSTTTKTLSEVPVIVVATESSDPTTIGIATTTIVGAVDDEKSNVGNVVATTDMSLGITESTTIGSSSIDDGYGIIDNEDIVDTRTLIEQSRQLLQSLKELQLQQQQLEEEVYESIEIEKQGLVVAETVPFTAETTTSYVPVDDDTLDIITAFDTIEETIQPTDPILTDSTDGFLSEIPPFVDAIENNDDKDLLVVDQSDTTNDTTIVGVTTDDNSIVATTTDPVSLLSSDDSSSLSIDDIPMDFEAENIETRALIEQSRELLLLSLKELQLQQQQLEEQVYEGINQVKQELSETPLRPEATTLVSINATALDTEQYQVEPIIISETQIPSEPEIIIPATISDENQTAEEDTTTTTPILSNYQDLPLDPIGTEDPDVIEELSSLIQDYTTTISVTESVAQEEEQLLSETEIIIPANISDQTVEEDTTTTPVLSDYQYLPLDPIGTDDPVVIEDSSLLTQEDTTTISGSSTEAVAQEEEQLLSETEIIIPATSSDKDQTVEEDTTTTPILNDYQYLPLDLIGTEDPAMIEDSLSLIQEDTTTIISTESVVQEEEQLLSKTEIIIPASNSDENQTVEEDTATTPMLSAYQDLPLDPIGTEDPAVIEELSSLIQDDSATLSSTESVVQEEQQIPDVIEEVPEDTTTITNDYFDSNDDDYKQLIEESKQLLSVLGQYKSSVSSSLSQYLEDLDMEQGTEQDQSQVDKAIDEIVVQQEVDDTKLEVQNDIGREPTYEQEQKQGQDIYYENTYEEMFQSPQLPGQDEATIKEEQSLYQTDDQLSKYTDNDTNDGVVSDASLSAEDPIIDSYTSENYVQDMSTLGNDIPVVDSVDYYSEVKPDSTNVDASYDDATIESALPETEQDVINLEIDELISMVDKITSDDTNVGIDEFPLLTMQDDVIASAAAAILNSVTDEIIDLPPVENNQEITAISSDQDRIEVSDMEPKVDTRSNDAENVIGTNEMDVTITGENVVTDAFDDVQTLPAISSDDTNVTDISYDDKESQGVGNFVSEDIKFKNVIDGTPDQLSPSGDVSSDLSISDEQELNGDDLASVQPASIQTNVPETINADTAINDQFDIDTVLEEIKVRMETSYNLDSAVNTDALGNAVDQEERMDSTEDISSIGLDASQSTVEGANNEFVVSEFNSNMLDVVSEEGINQTETGSLTVESFESNLELNAEDANELIGSLEADQDNDGISNDEFSDSLDPTSLSAAGLSDNTSILTDGNELASLELSTNGITSSSPTEVLDKNTGTLEKLDTIDPLAFVQGAAVLSSFVTPESKIVGNSDVVAEDEMEDLVDAVMREILEASYNNDENEFLKRIGDYYDDETNVLDKQEIEFTKQVLKTPERQNGTSLPLESQTSQLSESRTISLDDETDLVGDLPAVEPQESSIKVNSFNWGRQQSSPPFASRVPASVDSISKSLLDATTNVVSNYDSSIQNSVDDSTQSKAVEVGKETSSSIKDDEMPVPKTNTPLISDADILQQCRQMNEQTEKVVQQLRMDSDIKDIQKRKKEEQAKQTAIPFVRKVIDTTNSSSAEETSLSKTNKNDDEMKQKPTFIKGESTTRQNLGKENNPMKKRKNNRRKFKQ